MSEQRAFDLGYEAGYEITQVVIPEATDREQATELAYHRLGGIEARPELSSHPEAWANGRDEGINDALDESEKFGLHSRTKYRLEIECENAAFGPNPRERGIEVARILRELADEVEEEGLRERRPIRDAYGNTVGYAERIED